MQNHLAIDLLVAACVGADQGAFMSALEMLLKDFASRYATGDEVYMADVFLAPQIVVSTSRFNINMSKFPTLNRLYESYKILPEFEASSPERQPDAVH
ncbi:PREDICTED: glutathione S-transferase Z2-like [Prunus mume]|uniref:Glutathione S-transferase Z2-like n=1 Tax=Prunus mume TaxID=102107 RepID=A0ABM1LRQ7_PRUMU|nr:PREDICTED: glutathione S-transferase Z2-like [Prunus mume]